MVNVFRKSVIRKMKSSLFKGRGKEKEELASKAGSRGFTERQFKKELTDRGYKAPSKREKIISGATGKKPSEVKVNKAAPAEKKKVAPWRMQKATDTSVLQDDKSTGIIGRQTSKGSGFISSLNKPSVSISNAPKPASSPPKPPGGTRPIGM